MALSQSNQGPFRRYPFASICLCVTMVALALYGYRYGILNEERELLVQKRSEADLSQRNLRNSADLPEHLAALQKGVTSLEEKLMRPGDVAAYQQFFFKLETESGVKIARHQPVVSSRGAKETKDKPTGAYRPMAFEAVVDGTFAEGIRFLRNLESGPRHYRLVSLSVRRGGAPGTATADVVNLVVGLELLGSQ